MARIRTIKPEFPQSESIGRLSRNARLLYVNLITTVDDAGRARGSSRMLASLLYPYDNDAPGLIEGWLQELEQEGIARRYEFEGSTYLDLPNFLKHQKIDKPSQSRLPKFEDGSRVVAKPREVSTTDLVSVSVSSTETMDLLPAASQPEPKRTTTKVPRTRKAANINLPLGWIPSDEEWKYATSLGFTADAIDRQALEFTDHAKRVDRRCADWTAAWRGWLRKSLDFDPTNATRGINDRRSLAHASDDRAGFDDFLNGADRHG
jgi:hypothetical protein